MADASMLYTIGGYATLIGIGYAIYHISAQKEKKRGGVTITKSTKVSQPEPRKEDRKKKQRLESFVSDQDSKVYKTEPQSQDKEKVSEANQWLSDVPDDGKQEKVDNREFAKQLAKAKEGAKFNTTNDGPKQREKTVKQSKANKAKSTTENKPTAPAVPAIIPSAPSSTGADADDDESPVLSPEPHPADVNGVSDMLEPAPTGASVLRLTDTESKKQKKKAAKAPEQVETRKQRQNKKKAEAAKAAREEAEGERKILEEKQRRTARIAEGRPAKDGSQFMAAINGNKSVWTEGATTKDDTPSLHAPLDTIEKPTSAPKMEAALEPESSWISSLPSEEEQMEMLKEESDEWNTVKSKSSKKSRKAPSSVESGDEPSQTQAAAEPRQPVVNTKKSAKVTPTQNFGSFSALTTKDEPAEDAEEEWEV